MRKLWILGVIGTLAMLPFAALADTGGSATATLTINSVISTVVTDNWGDMQIDQSEIAGLAGATAVNWASENGGNTVTVAVYALTAFKVYSSYDDGNDLVTADGFLILTEGGDTYPLKSYQVTNPTNHGMNDTAASAALTWLGHWVGSTNIGSNGETHTYTVQWNPSLLPDLDAGDVLDLTIFFVVTDPNA